MDVEDRNILVRTLHYPDFNEESEVLLKKSVRTKHGEGLEQLRLLKLLVPFMTSQDGLKNLIYLFVRRTSDGLDALLKEVSRSKEALQIVEHFWALCFTQKDQLEQCQIHRPSKGDLQFVDVLPSLASVYLDLAISTYCVKEKIKKVSRQLYSALTFELNPRCLKTALLEVSLCSAQGAKLLRPLLRKVFLCSPETNSPMDYLLHTVALRRWTLVCDTLGEELQARSSIRAPANFVEWLSQRWPQAMDHFPLDKSLKGRRVTEVMLSLDQTATEELIDVFSQCLLSNQAEGTSLTAQVDIQTDQTQQLFVIDKKGTDVTADPAAPPSKRRHVLSESEGNLNTGDSTTEIPSTTSKKQNKKGVSTESLFTQLYSLDRGGAHNSLKKSKTANMIVQKNEFIDLSDAEGDGMIAFDEEASEGEEKGDDRDDDEMEEEDDEDEDDDDDDNEKDDADAESEQEENNGDDENEVDDIGDVSGSEEGEDESDSDGSSEIMGTDNSTIYKYRKDSLPPASSTSSPSQPKQSEQPKKQQSQKGGKTKHLKGIKANQLEAGGEPRVEHADGMEITVYTPNSQLEERSEETIKRMKAFEDFLYQEDRAIDEELSTSKVQIEDKLSQTLKAIRHSVTGETRMSKRHKKSESSQDGGDVVVSESNSDGASGAEGEKEEAGSEVEKDGRLSHWLRSPSKHKKGNKLSPQGQLQSDPTFSNKRKNPLQKSAADFFQDSTEKLSFTSLVSQKKKSPSPSKSPTRSKGMRKKALDLEVLSDELPRKASVSPGKSPSKSTKESPTKAATPFKSKLGKSLDKTQKSKRSSSASGEDTDSVYPATPKQIISDDKTVSASKATSSGKRKETGGPVQSAGKKQPGGMLRRTYYLRNLTEPHPEESQLHREGHDVCKEQTTPLTALKRKRRESEPAGSPQKSPVNRRKSLRSASKPKAK